MYFGNLTASQRLRMLGDESSSYSSHSSEQIDRLITRLDRNRATNGATWTTNSAIPPSPPPPPPPPVSQKNSFYAQKGDCMLSQQRSTFNMQQPHDSATFYHQEMNGKYRFESGIHEILPLRYYFELDKNRAQRIRDDFERQAEERRLARERNWAEWQEFRISSERRAEERRLAYERQEEERKASYERRKEELRVSHERRKLELERSMEKLRMGRRERRQILDGLAARSEHWVTKPHVSPRTKVPPTPSVPAFQSSPAPHHSSDKNLPQPPHECDSESIQDLFPSQDILDLQCDSRDVPLPIFAPEVTTTTTTTTTTSAVPIVAIPAGSSIFLSAEFIMETKVVWFNPLVVPIFAGFVRFLVSLDHYASVDSSPLRTMSRTSFVWDNG